MSGPLTFRGRPLPRAITLEAIEDACARRSMSLDNPGFCVACGAEREGCEPDMREGECEVCGEAQVYGAEEIYMEVCP